MERAKVVRSTLIICLLVWFSAPLAMGDLITAPNNLSLISTNAVNATSNPNFVSGNVFDGILNSTMSNGAVFDLPAQNPATWVVDVVNVAELETLLLHQLVGNFADNGIEDFSIMIFSGENLTGNLLLNQSFSAPLNSVNGPQSFALSSIVTNPESFILSVTSAHGNATRAEFSEIQFHGTVTTTPEPSALVLVLLAGFATVRTRCKRESLGCG